MESLLLLKRANKKFLEKKYSEAKCLYLDYINRFPQKKFIAELNLKIIEDIAHKRLFFGDDVVPNEEGRQYYECRIEACSGATLIGWIYSKINKNKEYIDLKLVIDGEKELYYRTTIFRADVNKVFGTSGKCGFKIFLPYEYIDGNTHSVEFFAKDENKLVHLCSLDFCQENEWQYEKKTGEKVVLFCSHNLRSQGAQNSLFELAIGMRRKFGITPIIYSPISGSLENKYKEHNVKVIIDNSVNLQLSSNKEWEEQISSITAKLNSVKCDVVIANTLLTFYMIHAANRLDLDSIFIPRESEDPNSYYNYLPSLVQKHARSTFFIANQVVFVADATRKLWSVLDFDKKFKVIHNSLNTSMLNQDSLYSKIEIRRSYGIEDDDIVLLSLGTVTPRKGQLDFIKSLPRVFSATEKKVKAMIVGIDSFKGKDTESYSKKIYETYSKFNDDYKRRVIFIPETDKQSYTKVYDFYSLADVYIFTSRIESFPRVILEALYFGLPIVTTPCFGVVEQCVDGVNSAFYEPGDYEGLAQRITTLINDETLRSKFSYESKRLFDNLQTYDQMLDNYYNLIRNSLREKND